MENIDYLFEHSHGRTPGKQPEFELQVYGMV